MEHARKPSQQKRTKVFATPVVRSLRPVALSPAVQRRRRLETDLVRFTATPVTAQRQVVAPVLQAAGLSRELDSGPQRAALQRSIAALSTQSRPQSSPQAQLNPQTPTALPAAGQRPAHGPLTAGRSAAEWVTVMRLQAETIEGKWLSSAQNAQFTQLQRQVSQRLAQDFRMDRKPATERYAHYAEHLVALQRHPQSAPVARAVLNLISPTERPALQRAVDVLSEQQALQRQQDQQAARLHDLQGQLATLDAESGRPVLERIQARRGAGSPLPAAIQRHLEQGLNHDLSRVRIHTDSESDVLAKQVNALAFTTGSDIFFRAGQYQPNTQSGLELMAHEVTHTVQQAQGKVGPGVDPDAGLEAEARSMGAKLAAQPLAPRFGTRATGSGHRNAALATSTPAVSPSVQRWGNPFKALQNVASSAAEVVSRSVQSVRQSASKAVTAAANKVTKLTAPAVRSLQSGVAQLRAQTQKSAAALGQAIQAARQQVSRSGQAVVRSMQQKLVQVKASSAQLGQKLVGSARQLAQKAMSATRKLGAKISQTTQKVTQDLKVKASQAGNQIKGAAQSAAGRGVSSVSRAVASVKAAAQPTLDRVAQRARTLKAQMKTSLAAAKANANTALAQAQAMQKKLTDKLSAARQSLTGGMKVAGGWISDKASQGKAWVSDTASKGWASAGKAKDSVVSGAKNAGSWISNKASQGKAWASDTVSKGWASAVKAKDSAGSWISDKASQTGAWVSDKASQGKAWVSDTASKGWASAVKVKDSVVSGAKNAGNWISDKASQTGAWVSDKASQGKAWASDTASKGLASAVKAKDSVVSGAKNAGNWISNKTQEGWSAAVKTKDQVVAKVNAIKNSPGFQSMVDKIKKAGIVVAKVGAAIIVGGIVIAGAAALTAATGGLAGPALVAALFASGALGGAASTLVGNALTGEKKLLKGISMKSMAIDGALGVLAGPLAKVAGGAIRAIARPVMSGLGKAATAVAPGLSASARGMSSAARVWTESAVGSANTYLKGKVMALDTWSNPGRAAIRTAWDPSLAGQATRAVGNGLRGLDTLASAGLRTAARVPDAAGSALAQPWKTMVGAVRSSSLVRAGRGALGKLSNQAAVAGYRARNAATQGWSTGKLKLTNFEFTTRRYLSSKGLSVNVGASFSRKAVDAVERTLSSMKTYASSQVRQISEEVREQWYGSAGIGGVLRTGRKMDELVTSDSTLAGAWRAEQRQARKALFNAGMRTVSNEVKAAGTPMSDVARRALVNSRITNDAVYDYAVRNVRGPFMARATASYRARSAVAQPGFDPSKNFIAQLPRVYATGVRQQVQSVRERGLALWNAGGMSGAVSVAGGWMGEEAFKVYGKGATDNYRTTPGWKPNVGEMSRAGIEGVRSNVGEIGKAAATGLTGQAFGPLLPLSPFNQAVKGMAEHSGLKNVTDTYELDDPASITLETPKAAHP